MTTRTWVAPPEGPRISYAWNNPHNWTPDGAPQAGDTLNMTVGQMDITNAKLPAELFVGNGPDQLSTGPVMLNMDNSSATVSALGGSFLNFNPDHLFRNQRVRHGPPNR